MPKQIVFGGECMFTFEVNVNVCVQTITWRMHRNGCYKFLQRNVQYIVCMLCLCVCTCVVHVSNINCGWVLSNISDLLQ